MLKNYIYLYYIPNQLNIPSPYPALPPPQFLATKSVNVEHVKLRLAPFVSPQVSLVSAGYGIRYTEYRIRDTDSRAAGLELGSN